MMSQIKVTEQFYMDKFYLFAHSYLASSQREDVITVKAKKQNVIG